MVDEDALVNALRSGNIAKAALDVFSKEPPRPDNLLLAMPTVVTSSHLAGQTREARADAGTVVAEPVIAGLAGRPALGAINREACLGRITDRAGCAHPTGNLERFRQRRGGQDCDILWSRCTRRRHRHQQGTDGRFLDDRLTTAKQLVQAVVPHSARGLQGWCALPPYGPRSTQEHRHRTGSSSEYHPWG